ncbi:hypothetical protein ACHAXM_010710 [Skeletonema potamos]
MNNNLVTLYRCDVCQTASFPTMEEAIAHENQCGRASPPPPPPPQQHIINTNPPKPANGNTTLRVKYFKCSNCKILFTDRVKARAHESTCTEPVWFSCRVCKVMRFSKAHTLIEHERVCKGPVPLTRKDLPLAEEILKNNRGTGVESDDSSVEIIEPPIKNISTVPNPLDVSAPPQSMKVKRDDSSVEIIESPRHTAASFPPSAQPTTAGNGSKVQDTHPNLFKRSQYYTCWTCDVCKVAQFKTFKEAEEHENQCMIELEKKMKSNTPPKKTNREAEYLSDSRQSSKNEDVVLFSPFVQGVSDSADFENLSNCHAAILQSVKLLHHPFNGSVALQCQYCNERLSSTWTLKKMTEMLPVQVCNHILECQNAPTEVVNSMQLHITNILQKSSEIVGELSLGSFLESFLVANGIVEGAIKRETRLLVLPDDKFRKITGFETSKRGRQASSRTALIGSKKGKRQEGSSAESSPAKRTKVQSLHEEIKVGDMDCQVHYDEGRSMYVAPLDGLPLLTSLLEKEAKYLHPSQKVLLAQLEIFKLSPKMMKHADIGSLGLRCQNCVTEKNGCCFMKLTSVNNLARDLLLFGKEHVVRCITKQKVTKQIHDALAGGDVELTTYCTLIANLYGLEEKTVNGKTQVIFGYSPTIPPGYSRPMDIDVRSILQAAEIVRKAAKDVAKFKATQKPAQDELKAPAVAPVPN